jgi:hypothetical protein
MWTASVNHVVLIELSLGSVVVTVEAKVSGFKTSMEILLTFG